MAERPLRSALSDYPHRNAMGTRLRDVDVYGHVNNVVYGEYFDTTVNAYLIAQGVLDMTGSDVIGLVVSSKTDFFAPVHFPSRLTIGLRVGAIGRSSVRYEFAAFREDETAAAAQGAFTHVYVDRATQRPVELPTALRTALEPLRSQAGA